MPRTWNPPPLKLGAWSLAAGLVVAVGVPVAIGVRLLPRGEGTTSLRLDWKHRYGLGWLATVDQTGWGWTRRAQSLVAPHSYGIAGGGMTLQIDGPREPGFPVEMPPRGGVADLEPAVAERIRTNPPAGAVLVWPFQMRLGWPARSMAYWHDGYYGWGSHGFATGAGRKARTAWGRDLTTRNPPFDAAIIPLEPLWAGLAINTGVFGAPVFAIAVAFRAARSTRRRRRGLCVACGYEVGTLERCPECGAWRIPR